AKKRTYYQGTALTSGKDVDDQIDIFEKWFNLNIGNPYSTGLDLEVIRLFASACAPIPKLTEAFDTFLDISAASPSWAAAVNHLHMELTSQEERDAHTKSTTLEACIQGTRGIVTYNHHFNQTLFKMQRYGYNMLASRADEVALTYIRNLSPRFQARLQAIPFSSAPPPQAVPQAPAAPTSPRPIQFPASVDPFGAAHDPEIMDLIREVENLHLTDAQQSMNVLRMLIKDRNLTRSAGSPKIHLASASGMAHSSSSGGHQRHMPGHSDNPQPSHAPSMRYPSNGQTRDYSTYRCRICGIMGHIAVSCPAKARDLICTNCEGKGHYSEDCPQQLGPRVLWMMDQDEYQNGTPHPIFNNNDDHFSDADRVIWQRERAFYRAECDQDRDFHLG
ncbi:hypothetical protein BGZ81_003649, partial [Podila clonocystis]